MTSWFSFCESNKTSQEIIGEIIGTISPEISSHKIIIPEIVLCQTKGIRRMIPKMT
jgi:hypothetical protein